MEEFTNKLVLKVEFGPVFSLQSNGILERNHVSFDVIVRKIIREDSEIYL